MRHLGHGVAVMYLGRIEETAPTHTLFSGSRHPCTRALLAAVTGDAPCPVDRPSGCPFHPRRPEVMDHCRSDFPPNAEIASDHRVECHLYREREPSLGNPGTPPRPVGRKDSRFLVARPIRLLSNF